jgi:apolipoprotein D and lipocalin family protein
LGRLEIGFRGRLPKPEIEELLAESKEKLMKIMLLFFIILSGPGLLHVHAETRPLEVVPSVDLSRYLGTWYEIATIPQRFQKDCVAVTATYTLRDDGTIGVENKCRKKTLDGDIKIARGKAWVVDKKTNAKLKVQFFWPFKGDYWIIELDPDYEFAVVGHPNRQYLWILSRAPHLEEGLYQELLQRIANKGYDISRIKRTLQPPKK